MATSIPPIDESDLKVIIDNYPDLRLLFEYMFGVLQDIRFDNDGVVRPPQWTDTEETANTANYGADEAGFIWFNTTDTEWHGWDGSSIVVIA